MGESHSVSEMVSQADEGMERMVAVLDQSVDRLSLILGKLDYTLSKSC